MLTINWATSTNLGVIRFRLLFDCTLTSDHSTVVCVLYPVMWHVLHLSFSDMISPPSHNVLGNFFPLSFLWCSCFPEALWKVLREGPSFSSASRCREHQWSRVTDFPVEKSSGDIFYSASSLQPVFCLHCPGSRNRSLVSSVVHFSLYTCWMNLQIDSSGMVFLWWFQLILELVAPFVAPSGCNISCCSISWQE